MEEIRMITKEMVLGQILSENPKAAEILMGCGMHCLGCPSSQMESLEDACMVHGLSIDELLNKLSNKIYK